MFLISVKCECKCAVHVMMPCSLTFWCCGFLFWPRVDGVVVVLR
jgi:hypothetical protein